VPAARVPLTKRPLPDKIYFDATFVVATLLKSDDRNRQSLDFLKDAAVDPAQLNSSTVLFPEVNDAIFKAIIRRDINKLAASRGDERAEQPGFWYARPEMVPPEVWDELGNVVDLMEELVTTAGIALFRADAPVRQEAYRLQRSHRLRAFDAIHAATCLTFRISDIVCYDRDFHHIDGLTIWEAR
jgi:predicted nucleic acid-binding protein